MFNAPTPPQPLSNQPSQSENLPDVPVYAMPEKFMSPQTANPQSSGGGGGSKKIFVIVIVIVALLLVGGGADAFLNFDKLFGPKTVANNNINNNPIVNQNNSNAGSNANNANKSNLNGNTNLNSNANSSGGFGNLNANANGNANNSLPGLNQNSNSNANKNDNSSLNSNSNTNAANSNINASSPLPPSKDTDEDGLTDSEEAVYQTNINVKDTDGDSYYDGAEVAAGFAPAKGSGDKLADSTAMKAYSNSS